MDKERLMEMNKSQEKYTLASDMTTEDLYQLMTERWDEELPAGPFVMKKGMMGQTIQFPSYQTVQPVVSVKGNVVLCKKTEGAKVEVMGVNRKDRKQRKEAFKAGNEGGGFMQGMKNAALGGVDYYLGVCNKLREILQDKM